MTREEKQKRIRERFGQLCVENRRQTGCAVDDPKTRLDLENRATQEIEAAIAAEEATAKTQEMTAGMRALARLKAGPLPARIAAGDVRAMGQFVEELAKAFTITVIWQDPSVFPDGAAAFAQWRNRSITLPFIATGHEDRFAVALHEIGHITAGPCKGAGHYVDPNTNKFHRCLGCEMTAWREALAFAPTDVLPLVHRRLRQSLEIYRASTPGQGQAFRDLDALCDEQTLRDIQRRRRMGQRYYEEKLAAASASRGRY